MPRLTVVVALLVSALFGPTSPAAAGPSVDVRAFGSAPALGAPEMALASRTVDIAAHPTRDGYWLLGRDGGVFAYGADFFGSTGGTALNRPVIAMAPTATGNGYWFVAEDGGVFSFGDARYHGSTGALELNARIVGMAATPTGNGYWLVSEDGGVFAFGDAAFHGSTPSAFGGVRAVAIASSPSGRGYVLLRADGALFSYGDAMSFTTTPMLGASDFALNASGAGAWVVGVDGGVYAYGDAPFVGAATGSGRDGTAIARNATGSGYWIVLVPRSADGPAVPMSAGAGRRVVYSNSMQRVWLIEADERIAHTFLVSGRAGVPRPGTHRVFSKTVMSSAHGGDLRLPYMTRFAHGRSLAIGFHGIPLRGNGTPIQSDAELGQYRSAGCVRMNQQQARVLWDFAPVGTPVIVLA
ncbi:MAG: L,D-transpeptidase family protein [Actinomycetota bacterium]